jgi:hypothetical protein
MYYALGFKGLRIYNTDFVSFTKANQLIFFGEIITDYSEEDAKNINM